MSTICKRCFLSFPHQCLEWIFWLFPERAYYYDLDKTSSLENQPTSLSIIGNSTKTQNYDGQYQHTFQLSEFKETHGFDDQSDGYDIATHVSVYGEVKPFDIGKNLEQFTPQLNTIYPATISDIPKRLVAALRGDPNEFSLLDGDKIIRGTGVKLIFNKLQADELRSICLAIRDNPSIKSLELGCNNLGDSSMQIITECLRGCTHLHYLAVWGNNISDSGLCSLSDFITTSKLESLILSNNEITDQGLSTLGFSVAACSTLRSLDLSVNSSISENGLSQLIKVLKQSNDCHLETLNLSNGNISDDGCQYIGSWLSQPCCPLVNLDLSFNVIEDSGVQSLSIALQMNTRLTELNLSGNLFTKFGMKCLSKSINRENCPNRIISMENILTSQF